MLRDDEFEREFVSLTRELQMGAAAIEGSIRAVLEDEQLTERARTLLEAARRHTIEMAPTIRQVKELVGRKP